MREIITKTLEPEVGDKAVIPAEKINSIASGDVGVIQSFGQHCQNCSRYCNIADSMGKIVYCPNVEDLTWDHERKLWLSPEEDNC